MRRKAPEPLLDLTFRNLGGAWCEIHDLNLLLSDVLSKYDILFDERTQFARLYDYDRNVVFWIRAYTMAKVTITLWPIDYNQPSNIN